MEFQGFTNASATLRCGVYLLCAKGQVIFVGKAKLMLSRIYSHRHIWTTKRRKGRAPEWLEGVIPGLLFDEVHIRPCAVEDLDRLAAEAIDRYQPKYNLHRRPCAPLEVVINSLSAGQLSLRRI